MSGPAPQLGYREIAAELRSAIPALKDRGVTRLPTQEELAERYDVSITTVRRAIDVLEREGLIDRRRRSGTVIRQRPHLQYRMGTDRYAKSLWKFEETPPFKFDRLKSDGSWDPADQTQQVNKVAADEEMAEAFSVDAGTVLWERARLVTEDGRPTHTLTSYYLPEHVDGTPLIDDTPGPSSKGGGFQVLALTGHEPQEITERISARMPTPDEREQLKLPEGEPVIVLQRLTFAAGDELVEFARGVHRASNFEWVYKFAIPESPEEPV